MHEQSLTAIICSWHSIVSRCFRLAYSTFMLYSSDFKQSSCHKTCDIHDWIIYSSDITYLCNKQRHDSSLQKSDS